MVHLALGVSIVLHDGVALLKVLGIFDDIIGIVWLRILGLASRGLPVGVPPFPGMVVDANSKPSPGKGAEDDPAVLDVHPLLAVQVESPQVAIYEEVQMGLWLRESGCCSIAN